ncbi:hypothetical protein FHS29_004108 [Saccharothrix tamanrassetensis]|uniref:LPXTG-motif cell wall-anchored protein n=1 Tax=Saccharothrix tamanrassetensis TaxID=1051531 RepID=A0A841CKP8_9PSEU|nr:hypothetical protein [Saccharothrix tamanrassetensis]MBB5957513.1 hypothetical protein [Saccharothrix tamanrassetensis]
MRLAARHLFGAAALLAATTLAVIPLATAAPKTHDSGDPRATVHEANVDIGQLGNACAAVGLPGEERELTGGYHVEGANIDITAHPDGYRITGVVVKGSSAANVYYATPPANVQPLGAIPWLDLHPPLNSSDEPAGISHWFVCAAEAETPRGDVPSSTTASSSSASSATGSTAPTTVSSTPAAGSSTPSTSTSAAATAITTTTSAFAPADAGGSRSNDDLASTGFGSLWLLFVGLALIAAGAVFVASPKLRALLRR